MFILVFSRKNVAIEEESCRRRQWAVVDVGGAVETIDKRADK